MDMRDKILSKLDEIERTENVKILHCIESGSRARGYALPDSDRDVRFVYVRPVEHYLKLETKKDVIEWQLDDTYDISGWDLQKFLRLTYSSNLSVYEWADSRVIYCTSEQWQRIAALLPEYYNAKPLVHHLLASSQTHYNKSLRGEQVKVKKYIHAILPLLQCRYILEKGERVPVDLNELINCVSDKRLAAAADMLIRERMDSETVERNDELNRYIGETIAEIRAAADTLPEGERPDREKLNICFVETLKDVWGKLL